MHQSDVERNFTAPRPPLAHSHPRIHCAVWCVSGARPGKSQAGPATSFGCVSETTRGFTPYGTPSGGSTTSFPDSALVSGCPPLGTPDCCKEPYPLATSWATAAAYRQQWWRLRSPGPWAHDSSQSEGSRSGARVLMTPFVLHLGPHDGNREVSTRLS